MVIFFSVGVFTALDFFLSLTLIDLYLRVEFFVEMSCDIDDINWRPKLEKYSFIFNLTYLIILVLCSRIITEMAKKTNFFSLSLLNLMTV